VATGPGKTSLAKGEIIEAILLDRRPPRSGDAYLRFIPRTEMDIAVVSAGVNLTLDEQGIVKAARVALGAAAPTVLLVEEAAEATQRSKRGGPEDDEDEGRLEGQRRVIQQLPAAERKILFWDQWLRPSGPDPTPRCHDQGGNAHGEVPISSVDSFVHCGKSLVATAEKPSYSAQ
jgi:hypothetical protein